MHALHAAIKQLLTRLDAMDPARQVYHNESIAVMRLRWKKLHGGGMDGMRCVMLMASRPVRCGEGHV